MPVKLQYKVQSLQSTSFEWIHQSRDVQVSIIDSSYCKQTSDAQHFSPPQPLTSAEGNTAGICKSDSQLCFFGLNDVVKFDTTRFS